jgi:uncharacterized repeat protein (TIGR04076 family)
MTGRYTVRITVVKRLFNEDMVDKYAEPEGEWAPCQMLKEGQEFLVKNLEMPFGFCSWAWADIQKLVVALARGADFWDVKPGVFVTCCTDGFRPVIFKLERANEEA